MLKLILHVVIFAIGAGVGVYWGVHHPTQAADLASQETLKIQQAVAIAKQQVLTQVVADQSTPQPAVPPVPGAPATAAPASQLSKYQQMLDKAKQELGDAQSKLQNAPQ